MIVNTFIEKVICAPRFVVQEAIGNRPQGGATQDTQPRSESGQTDQPSSSLLQEPTEIVVRGVETKVVNGLDRKVYDVSGDLAAAGGSAADLLEHIPFVSVDTQGNISIRGDSNVQVLVNGRISPELNGLSVSSALAQLSANRIAKIEIITTPPAQLAGGTGGIVNIILKSAKDATSFNVNTSLGSAGRFAVSPVAEATFGSLRLNTSLNIRNDIKERSARDVKIIDVEDRNVPQELDQARIIDTRRVVTTVKGGVNLRISQKDSLDLQLSDSIRDDNPILRERSSTNIVNYPYFYYPTYRQRGGDERQINRSASITLRHDTNRTGGGLEVSFSTASGINRQTFSYNELGTFSKLPVSYVQYSSVFERVSEGSAGYDGPLFGSDNASAGINRSIDQATTSQNQLSSADVGGDFYSSVDFSGYFKYKQVLNAIYLNYRITRGGVTVDGGWRYEHAETLAGTGGLNSSLAKQANFLPSLHARKRLGASSSFTVGFSRRLTRPDAGDLISFPVLQDGYTIRSPNGNILPQVANTFEASVESGAGSATSSYNVYYKDIENAMVLRSSIFGGVTNSTLVNADHLLSFGIESAKSGRVSRVFKYSISSGISIDRIRSYAYSLSRGVLNYNAKASLTWNINHANVMQASFSSTGLRPMLQGFLVGYQQLDLGFRRTLGRGLSATITVSDIMGTHRDGFQIDDVGFHDRMVRRQHGQIAAFSLTWSASNKTHNTPERFKYEE